jgi:hypothetical protein
MNDELDDKPEEIRVTDGLEATVEKWMRNARRAETAELRAELAKHPCEICGKPATQWTRSLHTAEPTHPFFETMVGSPVQFWCDEHGR